MEIYQDFRELLESFAAREVEYLIVGAHALAHHGVPRATGDLDIWVRPTAENAARVLAALTDFGFGGLDLTAADFSEPDRVVQLGVSPVRIDILSSLSGLTWEQAVAGHDVGSFAGVPAPYLGREQLIANKRATGRHQDLADLDALGEGT